MSATLPRWVYRLIMLLVERHDTEALRLVPYEAQIRAKAIADADERRGQR